MPADAAVVSAAEPTRFRVALNRFLFRAMLFASGSVAIGLYQISRPLAWRFAKLQARNLMRVWFSQGALKQPWTPRRRLVKIASVKITP